MNPARGGGIESGKQAVERAGPAEFPGGQPVAQALVARRAFEEAVQKSAQVKAGASGNYGEAAACRNGGNGFARQAGIFTGGEEFVGIDDVDEVVGNAAALRQRQLGGSDIEVPVDLERVAVDHFAVESFRQGQRQAAFSGARGTGHCNQRALRCIRSYSAIHLVIQ